MTRYRLVEHAPGAPGLRWLGLGTDLRPTRGLLKLQRLFRKHAFWAQNRNLRQLKRMLTGSTVGGKPLARQAPGGLWAGNKRRRLSRRALGCGGG